MMRANPPRYPRTFHWYESPEVHADDSYHANPSIFVGEDIVITEKLDGGNTCLWNGDVYARSTSSPSNDGWFAMVKKHHAWKTINENPDLFFYGEEIFGVHSIAYDAISEAETYHLFNVRFEDTWLSWEGVEYFARKLEIPTVPVLFRGKFNNIEQISNFMHENIKQPSVLGPDREGFVIRFMSAFQHDEFQTKVAKYVRKHHVQTDEHWRSNWKSAELKKE